MWPQDSIDTEKDKVFAERVSIPAESCSLESWLAYDPDRTICDGVVLLPPHPNFAGTMDNNVIKELAVFLGVWGYAVLRFNYPGVGASSITLPEGASVFDYWNDVEKEQRFDEAVRPSAAAVRFLQDSLGAFIDETHLIGYSYGGIVAMMLAGEMSDVSSATAISMPWVARYNYDFLRNVHCPKFFIRGKQDFTFDANVYQRVWPLVGEPKHFRSVYDDHFFRKSEKELARHIADLLFSLKRNARVIYQDKHISNR